MSKIITLGDSAEKKMQKKVHTIEKKMGLLREEISLLESIIIYIKKHNV